MAHGFYLLMMGSDQNSWFLPRRILLCALPLGLVPYLCLTGTQLRPSTPSSGFITSLPPAINIGCFHVGELGPKLMVLGSSPFVQHAASMQNPTLGTAAGFFLFVCLAAPGTGSSSWARDQTCSTATRATAVTMPNP